MIILFLRFKLCHGYKVQLVVRCGKISMGPYIRLITWVIVKYDEIFHEDRSVFHEPKASGIRVK